MASLDFEPQTYGELSPERRPTLAQALVPILGVVVFLGVGSGYLGMNPHAPLVWSVVLTGLVGYYWMDLSWDVLYEGIADGLLMGLQAILILFTIYALIATWVSAGTIPGLMHYGLSILTPEVFLPATAILAAVVAFSIGSSWTTAGTLGVAFVGIGSGLGIPAPMTAGAILSGAYAGDKQSPLSDTTNLAAAVTNTNLYDHIRAMRTGTAIALGLSLILYALLGLRAGGAIPEGRVAEIQGALAGTYDLSVFVFLPLVVTFGLALYGYPALPSLVAGVFAGVFTTMAVQGVGFTAAWDVFLNGTAPQTGTKLVNDLLAQDGLTGSAWTITVVVAALSLGGLLERLGVLAVLAHHLAQGVRSGTSLVATSGLSAILVNIFSAQQYMAIVIPGMTLRNLYDEYDLESSDLSRAVEAAGTPTGALIPWHAGAVYMSSVFGVPTLAFSWGEPATILNSYFPFYFFAFLSPLVLFVMTLLGRATTPKDSADSSVPSSADD
ncbi:Na+/H+ antiporter NhaC family protein [Halorussus gelatinilyticus]|uniref:Na+/H+ antiporter NhaC family protein n=1 Tax=Halorussus gelatinilyticus TaxID=2937524 RepID=A0A8U0IJF7_9EURY|nr:Na+/H+ antiporter NhaC family protein [Halorussus gelatinilyticus]UPW00815.1 Na+/H+ antiporter NhaC family protein [Halorussus gelatinilyticus]